MPDSPKTSPAADSAADPAPPDAEPAPIVFYDGDCAMCSRLVRSVLRMDRSGELRFAPLRGRTAAERIPAELRESAVDSMIYLDERGLHVESDAAIAVARRAGGVGALAGVARILPRRLRDALYRFVARHRHRIPGGRGDACLVRPEDDARFLP